MLFAAALASSTDLETESDWKSSSSTATEEAVSLAETAGTETDSTEGIVGRGLKLDEEAEMMKGYLKKLLLKQRRERKQRSSDAEKEDQRSNFCVS